MPMKTRLFFSLFILFHSSLLYSQGFSDDFSDGNFTANPTWLGDVSKFIVNANNMLQLDDPSPTSSNEAYLITNSSVINKASWEFQLTLDFAPSTSNFAKVYLVSSNQDLSASLNGYFVKIGGISGSVDDISLYRQDGSQEVEIIDGRDGLAGFDPVSMKIKVTRDSIGEWELFTDTSTARNTYFSEGKAIDLVYDQSSYFGVYCKYSSTRSDKFTFDDFQVSGEAFQDTSKPFILNISSSSANSLQLNFSESVEPISALNTSNYSLDQGIGSPVSASYIGTDSSKLSLSFSSSFVNGETHNLNIQNVSDLNGNTLTQGNASFFFFQAVPADFRDITINELLPDPSPSQGLPTLEFIELFNASDKVFDLDQWVISDASSSASLTSYIFKPGSNLILCEITDTAAFSSFGEVLGVQSLPSLNNGGDRVILVDPNANLIDQIQYDLDWYKDFNKQDGGYSLEQINPFTGCFGKQNFKASIALSGGSPGQQNSVFDTLPDLTPPLLTEFFSLSPDSIELRFNEFMDSTSLKTTSNYTFNTNANVVGVILDRIEYASVTLVLSPPLDSGIINTLSISGLSDCAGNLIPTAIQREFVIPSKAGFRDIVINEFLADPFPSQGLPESEFIELYNVSDEILDIKNWKLGDKSVQATLSAHLIKPGEHLIICPQESASAFSGFGSTQGQNSFPSLGNSSDVIQLFDDNGVLIDEVNYTIDWFQNSFKAEGGYSLEQIRPNRPCTGVDNFIGSHSSIGGTPGQLNSVFESSLDTVGPLLLKIEVQSKDSLVFHFNEGLSALAPDLNQITFSVTNMAINYSIISQESYGVKLLNPLDSGIEVQITIDSVIDCSGNVSDLQFSTIVLPQTALFNDLVINELLFNPRSDGVDFVELYNRSDKVISLKGWQLANFANDSISNLKEISSEPLILYSGDYAVITEDPVKVKKNYPNAIADNLYVIADLPSYNDTEGRVFLFNAQESLIDDFLYTDEMHFPLLNDDEGVSLERVDPYRATNEMGNFQSASEQEGFATPGYINSQFFESTAFSGEFTVEPEVFTPDNDGDRDIVNFNYVVDGPGYAADIKIYDRQARLIRHLVNNELISTRGVFTWDGLNDENQKARIGIYLIVFEVYDAKGNQEVYKAPCVLGGRL